MTGRRVVFGVVAIAALLTAGVAAVFAWSVAVHKGWIPPRLGYRFELQRASKFIEEVEAFRRLHGRLPEPAEVKPPAGEEPPFSVRYELAKRKDEYTITVSAGGDERFAYRSATRRWSFDERISP